MSVSVKNSNKLMDGLNVAVEGLGVAIDELESSSFVRAMLCDMLVSVGELVSEYKNDA